MKELTEKQREPLFEVVRHYNNADADMAYVVFDHAEDHIVLIFPHPHDVGTTDVVATTHPETFRTWESFGYITPYSTRDFYYEGEFYYKGSYHREDHWDTLNTFTLNEGTLKYARLMQMPRFVRWLSITWGKLIDDTPSLIWGVVGGVMGGVLTAIILYLLGLASP